MQSALRLISAGVLAAASVWSSSVAMADPPTDAQVDAFIASVKDAGKDEQDGAKKAKAKAKALADGIKEISLGEATIGQLKKIEQARIVGANQDAVRTISVRVKELAEAPGADGARAAEYRLAYVPNPAQPSREASAKRAADIARLAAEVVKHPGMAEHIKNGGGEFLLRTVATASPELTAEHKLLEAVEPFVTTDLSLGAATSLASLATKVADPDAKLDAATRDRWLDKIAAAAESAAARAKNAPDDDLPKLNRVKDAAKIARSSWAHGKLIGGPAPEIKFTWSSPQTDLKSLADLKGKVVLLDFWATWCGPCRAAFPKMAQLQERYKDYPVAIVGVTSLQGYHIDPKNPEKMERIDCKNDAAKEMGLMPGFIADQKMTWTVVFSEDGCFNPFYGVSGIPHLAIIAPDGTVRFNELRPRDPAEEAEKIDGLLKEFKLKAPERPMEPASAE